ncbi:hypothetical protein [Henriciella marina]|uniref:hypothetical protein n=1 Tax=Henriciella marina TaxID=453851 RepID=UPI00039BB26B|nr:hypothetical protein [Henriciella marina]
MKFIPAGILLSVFGLPAGAGPWGQPDEAAYGRFAINRTEVEGLPGLRTDIYGEYGISDHWTLTAKYERVTFDEFSEFTASGWRSTLRRSISLADAWTASLEAGVLEGEAIGGAAGCQSIGAEGRSGIGRSFARGKGTKRRNGFWFAEAAIRAHSDGCQRYRLEAGYGREMTRNIWLVNQVWLDQGSENARSIKYQFEYVWRREVFDISAGSLLELGGEFEEAGLFLALARRF